MILCTSLLLALVGTSSAFVSQSQATTRARSQCTSLQANIAVFGASGLTASECVYQALKDGDNVVGLTRNPSNLKVPKGSGGADAENPLVDEKLTLIGGDVTKMSDVEKGESAAVAKQVTLSSFMSFVLRTAHVKHHTKLFEQYSKTILTVSSSRWAGRRQMLETRCSLTVRTISLRL